MTKMNYEEMAAAQRLNEVKLASDALENARKSYGYIANKHRVVIFPELHVAILNDESSALDLIKSITDEIYKGEWFCTRKQYRAIRKLEDMLNIKHVSKNYTVPEASELIAELKKKAQNLPPTDKQKKILNAGRFVLSIGKEAEEVKTFSQASDFIAKYGYKIRGLQNIVKQFPRAEVNALCKLTGADWDADRLLTMVDEEHPKSSIKRFSEYVESLKAEATTMENKTSLAKSYKRESLSKEEQIEAIAHKIWAQVGCDKPHDQFYDSYESMKELCDFVKTETGLAPIMAFKGYNCYDEVEIAYVTGLSVAQVKKYLNK